MATARLRGDVDSPGDESISRTLLHVVTDWPGPYPNGAATVAALVDAGADVNAPFVGRHSERPLHWAASSDDVEVLDALLDATVFGRWRAARRLVERGARCGRWDAAVLGDVAGLAGLLSEQPAPSGEDINGFFWGACHGGQRETAEYLRARGADVNWVGWDNLTPKGAARRSGVTALVAWLHQQGAR